MTVKSLIQNPLRNLLTVTLFLLLQSPGLSAEGESADAQLTAEWLARQEIAELQRRYAQATDMMAGGDAANAKKVAALYRQIFTEDAPMSVKNQFTLEGPMQWLELVQDRLGSLESAQHLIGSQLVEIQSLPNQKGDGGAATMRSYLQATHIEKDGTLERVLGIYHAEAVYLGSAGWRLSKMILEPLSVETAKRD